MDDETAPSLPVEPPLPPQGPQDGGCGGNGPPTEREGKPFPWKALHRSLTRRIGELVDQAARLDWLLNELKVLDSVHSEFHVVDDE